ALYSSILENNRPTDKGHSQFLYVFIGRPYGQLSVMRALRPAQRVPAFVLRGKDERTAVGWNSQCARPTTHSRRYG
ncbi:MAG: hypothetical protein PVF82_02645, partial [Gammaproteobacteria bacterium]